MVVERSESQVYRQEFQTVFSSLIYTAAEMKDD